MRNTRTQEPPLHVCDDCIYAKPYDVWWNMGANGKPITMHCHQDPEYIIKGIFYGTAACKNYKKQQ